MLLYIFFKNLFEDVMNKENKNLFPRSLGKLYQVNREGVASRPLCDRGSPNRLVWQYANGNKPKTVL